MEEAVIVAFAVIGIIVSLIGIVHCVNVVVEFIREIKGTNRSLQYVRESYLPEMRSDFRGSLWREQSRIKEVERRLSKVERSLLQEKE